MIEEEEKLAEIVQRLVTATERSAMSVLGDDAIANAMNSTNPKFGQILAVTDLCGDRGHAIA
jgi:hypothetical protein